MSSVRQECPICGPNVITTISGTDSRSMAFSCEACGSSEITPEALTELARLSQDDKWRLSAALRAAHDRGKRRFITTENLREVLETIPARRDPVEPVDLAVLYLGERAGRVLASVSFVGRDFPLFHARGPDEVGYIKNFLKDDLGWARANGDGLMLTPKGWTRFFELRKVAADPSQAFVAMSFAPEHRFIWTEGLEPALEGCGYSPVRIDEKHFSETIDDFMIATIRKSGLLVADFTGNKANVYFEAGFAMGLGIAVIRTCKAEELGAVRFDQNHYPILPWNSTEHLQGILTDRVNALGPLGKRPASGESR